MKKIVLINVSFKDRYTGEQHIAGKTTEMTDERIKEVKEIDQNLISVVGIVEEPQQGYNMGDTEVEEENIEEIPEVEEPVHKRKGRK